MPSMILSSDESALRWALRVSSAMGSGTDWIHEDGATALAAMRRERFDLVFVDRRLPAVDALALIRATRAEPAHAHVPVVAISPTSCPRSRREALEAGATGSFSQDDEPGEAAAWLANLIAFAKASAWRGAACRREGMEPGDFDEAAPTRHEEVLDILARMVEYRDNDTGDHTLRVARHSEMLARELGLPPAVCHAIRLASPLHDIGKVAIPDALLLKPGRLSDEEMAVVRTHAEIGERILGKRAGGLVGLAAEIAGHHHERWDGTGYPRGVSGVDIPLSARIVAVADVFDAMTSERPYKAALPIQEALDHVLAEAGRHFDPRCAKAFVDAYRAQHTFYCPHVADAREASSRPDATRMPAIVARRRCA